MCCADWLGLSQVCALDTQEGTILLEPDDLRVGKAGLSVGTQGPETRGGGEGGWTDRFQAMESLWTAEGLPPNPPIMCVHMIRRRVLPFPEPQFPHQNRDSSELSKL